MNDGAGTTDGPDIPKRSIPRWPWKLPYGTGNCQHHRFAASDWLDDWPTVGVLRHVDDRSGKVFGLRHRPSLCSVGATVKAKPATAATKRPSRKKSSMSCVLRRSFRLPHVCEPRGN